MAHFLFATSLISSVYLHHLSNSHYQIWDEAISDHFHLLAYGLESFHHNGNAFRSSTLNIICSNSQREIVSNEVQFILRDYHRYSFDGTNNHQEWIIHQPNVSCVLTDHSRKLLWLIGDQSSTYPLWFSQQQDGLVVTTDLFGAVALGHLDLKVVGAGVTLAIDLTLPSLKILQINHWPQSPPCKGGCHQDQMTLLKEAQRVLTPLVASASITSELNLLDDSSILLECALATHPNQIDKTRLRHRSSTMPDSGKESPHQLLIDPYPSCELQLFSPS
jgi:hypothetical protein